MIVPDKTIVYMPVISESGRKEFSSDISSFLKVLNKDHKRNWFTPNFYKCLPLSIGNMQGFTFSVPFTFDVIWNGGIDSEDIKITRYDDYPEDFIGMDHIHVSSEFGHGIFTVHMPITLKTPKGVNLITIAPPNFPTPGFSPMTGVIEADNLRFTFTLNFKVDLINTTIRIVKDTPIMGILPIPRYYCDSFELINAYDIFDKSIIEEEREVIKKHSDLRQKTLDNGLDQDGLYYKGMDVEKNKFKDHQLPRKNK